MERGQTKAIGDAIVYARDKYINSTRTLRSDTCTRAHAYAHVYIGDRVTRDRNFRFLPQASACGSERRSGCRWVGDSLTVRAEWRVLPAEAPRMPSHIQGIALSIRQPSHPCIDASIHSSTDPSTHLLIHGCMAASLCLFIPFLGAGGGIQPAADDQHALLTIWHGNLNTAAKICVVVVF